MIRKYKNEDIDAVVSIWRAASEYAHPFLSDTFLDQEADNLRNVYVVFAEIWVTEREGRVVGFIALIDNEIGGLFLDPVLHGQGFGKAMVDHAVAEKGDLTVSVFKKNAIGRRFYDAYGFLAVENFIHEESGQETIRMRYSPK